MEMTGDYPPCQWHFNQIDAADRMLLKYIDNAEKRSPLFTRLEADLAECWDCMEVYHEARERLVSKKPQTGYYDIDRILFKLEGKRVKESLNQETGDELEDLILVIHEVTEHPFLLFNQEIESTFCRKLIELNNSIGLEAFLPHRIPSMYLLVIHPERQIREIAWQCLQQPKYHITSDLYDHISPVLSWVLNLHLAGYLDPTKMEVSSHQTPSQPEVLPPHLFCTESLNSYWQGVAYLFEILSEDALKHRFMNSPCHKEITPVLIDTISNYDDYSSTDSPFWWQLQCLTYLIAKLGSNVWQEVSKSKIEGFFDIVERHPVFLQALEAILTRDHNLTSMRRDPSAASQSSLLVDPSEPVQWIVPYVNSLVDFGDSVSNNFCVVITFLCSKLLDLLRRDYIEQRGCSDTKDEGRRNKPLDSLIEKLMLVLVRVLECLQKNSLLGSLVDKNKTPQWLNILFTFLKQHPPVCSKSDTSRLVALSNEARQLLLDVFRSSKKYSRATIGQLVRYIKMLSLPLSTARPGSTAAQNVDQTKLWDVSLNGKEFRDCVRFVEKILQAVPLTSRSKPQRLEERNHGHQQLDSSKQSSMNIPAAPININPHGRTQLSSNMKHSNAPGSSSSSPSEHSESVLIQVVPSRQPRRNLADEFPSDLEPCEESISEENEIIQISSDSDQTLPNTSTPKTENNCSSKYKSPISSSDEVALISDIMERGETSSSLEDIFDSSKVESQKEERQIKTEGGSPRTDFTHRSQDSRWQPQVGLERIPELKELDWSTKQVIVTSINPLVINKVDRNSQTTRPEWSTSSNRETTEDMAFSDSILCGSMNRNVSPHKTKQEEMWREERMEEEVCLPSCSYQSTHCPPTPQQSFMSSSNSSLSGTPSPMSRRSSSKYPKNRLSLRKRNKRRHLITSSSDEDEVETQIFKPDIQEIKQPLKMKEDVKEETWGDQDQESLKRDNKDEQEEEMEFSEVETQIFKPDIREIKQPLKMKEDVKEETCDDQDQESVKRDIEDEQEEEMEFSESSPSCHKDNSAGERAYMIYSDELTEIAEVAKDEASSDEELTGNEETSSLIAGDSGDEAMQDFMNSGSDDSECSQSLLTQNDPPKDAPSPKDSSCSADSFININVFKEDKPTASQDEGNNNHVSPDNQIEEFTLASEAPDEDIKPIVGFIKLKTKSFSSSYDDSSMLSYSEDHQEDDDIIDLESYNCSQLFDEDRFSQLTPCIEISSDSDIDLDVPEPQFYIDLDAVKQEREDSERDELGTESGIPPGSQSDYTLDSALHNDNDADTMWFEEEEDINDGDDERAREDDGDDDENGDEDNDGDDVFLEENILAEAQPISFESEEKPASTEKNEKLTTKTFYGNKLPEKLHFLDVLVSNEDDEDEFINDQQTVPKEKRFGQEKEKTDVTWETIEAEAVSRNKQKKIKRKKRRITPDKQRRGLAGQGASKLAATQEGTVRALQSGVDVPSTSGQPVAEPRVQGSWKVSRQQYLESTPTDAEPMKTIGSSEQPIITDTFALDDSQTYRRQKPSNQQEDKPRAAMQSVANRFKSRTSVLTQEIKKDKTSQRDGMAKTRHSSGGQDAGASKVRHDSLKKGGGPSRIRHASSPSSVQKSLSTPSSSSGVLHDKIDQLPVYAQSVYNIKASIPATHGVSAAEKAAPNIPGATEPSCSDARLTHPDHVEPVGVAFQQQKDPSRPSPSDESLSATSGPAFRFFTSDSQTVRTAATLSSNAVNGINKNQTTSQVPHQTQNSACEKVGAHNQAQTLRHPNQRSKSHNEEMVAGRPLPLQAIEVNAERTVAGQPRPLPRATKVRAKPGLVLQGKEAVRLPKSSGLTENDFYSWVIGWDSQWLDICGPDAGKELRRCPPILAECPYKSLRSVPLSFDSVQEYYQVFIPLLLHEVWAQIQNKVHTSPVVPALFVEVKQREKRLTGFLLNCTCRVTVPAGMCPVTCSDLLRISSDTNAFCRLPLLAVVTNIMPSLHRAASSTTKSSRDSPSKVSDPSHPTEGKSWDISFLILAKNEDIYRALLSTVNHNVKLQVIQSLLPPLRQFKALTSLPKLGIIASDILRFRRMDVYCPGPALPVQTLEMQKKLNKSQVKAISVAFQAIALPDTLPRICMIQGPPGTGKTHAVLELVMRLLRSRMEHPSHNPHPGIRPQGSRPPKAPPILLCAPSNTAIDVLVRHLTFNKRDISCNIVRIGSAHHLHQTIRKLGIESIVQSQRAGEASKNLFNQTRKKKIAESLQDQIIELGKSCGRHKMRGEENEFSKVQIEKNNLIRKLKIVHSEIKDLQRQQAELDRKPDRLYEMDIINNADIVCCTVNNCGSKLLHRSMNADGKLKMMKFSCVIMDEANQCTELDAIISLQNCSMKVVLVGDTQSQLPMVSSMIARQYGLHLSLFERLCRLFEWANGTPSPVHYLQIQLRMHPAISQFPAKHFYRGRMGNDKKMAQKKKAFFLHPYLVFNVSEGHEVQTPSRNFTNKAEADMVQAVYFMICQEKRRNQTMLKELMSVGITTLYKEQAQCLNSRIIKTQEEIKRSFPSEFVPPVVEVSTLDLFQGREKDVIILCCVRAKGSSDHTALGMVGDKKVLNVFITRARYSLFIVGHLPTLQRNSDWDALATDARQRQLVIDVAPNEYNSAAQHCSKSIEELQTDRGNATQTAPSAAPHQSQTSQNVAPSTACTGTERSYVPHKMVQPDLAGSKHSCSPKTQVEPRQTAVVSPSTLRDEMSTSGAIGVNTIGQSTVHRNPKPLKVKSNIASPNAMKSPLKKRRVSFQVDNNQAMNDKSIQLSLTPKPMQQSNVMQSPTKHNPYSFVLQKLESQCTTSYNKLGKKRRSPKKQKGIRHSNPVISAPEESRQTRMQPVAAQAQLPGNMANKSSSSQGKTQNLSSIDRSKIDEQCVIEAAGEYERQNQRSATSKFLRNEQPNQKPVTSHSIGSHHTHLPGSPGYCSALGTNRMTTNNTTAQSGTHPDRNATISSPAMSPAQSNKRLTVPLQRNISSSSEVHQPSMSGSGQLGAAPNLEQAVEKIKLKYANTKTTRALHGLQPDPKQVRRQLIHEARIMESDSNDPVRIPYSNRENTSFE